MAFKSALILLAFVGFCSTENFNRVVGGRPTNIDKYPSLVQIEFFEVSNNVWTQSCAGGILTSVHILSAAHCFDGPTFQIENRRIRAGTSELGTGGQVVGLQWARNHPLYNQSVSHDSDISVARTSTPLVLTPEVAQGSIFTQGWQIPDNVAVTYAGWGATQWEGPASSVLQEVTLLTIHNELCRDRYINQQPWPGNVTENMICAGIYNVGGFGVCHGDDGGPLYYENIIVGIFSWGYRCADDRFPSVSTAVSHYSNWIIETAV